MELILDMALDVVGRELGDEVVGVRGRSNAVADSELAPERLLRGVVLNAEDLAEVEPGQVVVVLDEAGALAS